MLDLSSHPLAARPRVRPWPGSPGVLEVHSAGGIERGRELLQGVAEMSENCPNCGSPHRVITYNYTGMSHVCMNCGEIISILQTSEWRDREDSI